MKESYVKGLANRDGPESGTGAPLTRPALMNDDVGVTAPTPGPNVIRSDMTNTPSCKRQLLPSAMLCSASRDRLYLISKGEFDRLWAWRIHRKLSQLGRITPSLTAIGKRIQTTVKWITFLALHSLMPICGKRFSLSECYSKKHLHSYDLAALAHDVQPRIYPRGAKLDVRRRDRNRHSLSVLLELPIHLSVL